LNQLRAFKTAGFALAARKDGFAATLEITFDPSKFDPETRAAMSAAKHRNAVIGWVPNDAYGFFAATGLKRTVPQLVNSVGTDADTRAMLTRLGLTDSTGVLAHIGDDYGVEAGRGDGKTVAGAAMVSTDDVSVTSRFLDRLGLEVTRVLSPAPAPAPRSATPKTPTVAPKPVTPALKWQVERYKGIDIHFLREPALEQSGVVPAYAVAPGTPNMAILASTLREAEYVIDHHAAGHDITTDDTYRAASAGLPLEISGAAYLDIDRSRVAVEKVIPKDQRAEYDKSAPDLAVLRALLITAQNDENHASERILLLLH
jgi:hypothetical protein